MNLGSAPCEACTTDTPTASQQEIRDLKQELPTWEVASIDGIEQLRRVFPFDDFASALAFTNALGAEAEKEQHHPAITTEFGSCTVRWWTHKIDGLHRNDFIMAARTEDLFQTDGVSR
jgi:4a-hydroxytetrahydrobiopterin dehydratase